MRVFEELPEQTPDNPTALTVGVFDGVHLGHIHLLNRTIEIASQNNMLSAVITFSNHPRTVLSPDSPTNYLSSLEDRLTMLEATGIDIVVPLTFDGELSRLRAKEFTSILMDKMNMAILVVGDDFVMGYQREGTTKVLESIGIETGFSISVLDPLSLGNTQISSTSIRQAILTGNMTAAAELLGRHFYINAKVIHGDARGRTMGFPTANLKVDSPHIIPIDGIYATYTTIDRKKYSSATSIGLRPTFGGKERVVETFVLDYTGDLYGSDIKVEFVERVRDQVYFETADALAEQMDSDIYNIRNLLNNKRHDMQN